MPLTNNPFNNLNSRFKSRLLTLPIKVGDTAILYTKQRFAQANWIDHRVESWRPRKAVTKWGKTKRNKGRALLVDTGRLRRSIRIMGKTSSSVTIGSDVPYASVHNDGFRGSVSQRVKAHTRKKTAGKMLKNGTRSKKTREVIGSSQVKAHSRTIKQNIPRRRYIGQSQYLTKQITRLISSEIMKSMK